jgi:DNA mismatch repair protein MutL
LVGRGVVSIRVLPANIINQIAAGEVIERPASIIKELVENALDARATCIKISVQRGGISYICIQDNGSGMSKQDLELCIQRHATSKLTGKNLLDIKSFGFRGEALPSICSIARVKITTKQSGDAVGWALKVDGGNVVDMVPEKCEVGTTVSVSDLFYTTPARLKFVKSPTTELAHIINTVKMLALANPHTAFHFESQRRDFGFPATDTYETRIASVIGGDVFANGEMLETDPIAKRIGGRSLGAQATSRTSGTAQAEHRSNEPTSFLRLGMQTGTPAINGWLALPTYKNIAISYLFVNGRCVKDRLLSAAVRTAYQDVTIPGELPPFVLFLNIDPQEVDANVHPAKTEIRFRRPSDVRSFVIHSIKRKLSTMSRKTSVNIPEALFSNDGGLQNFAFSSSPSTSMPSAPSVPHTTFGELHYDVCETANLERPPYATPLFAQDSILAQEPFLPTNASFVCPANSVADYSQTPLVCNKQTPNFQGIEQLENPEKRGALLCHDAADVGAPAEDGNLALKDARPSKQETGSGDFLDLGIAKAQVFSSYIISQNADSMFLVDQHAVHERVVFESIKKEIFIDDDGWIVSKLPVQKLLLPEKVQLANADFFKEFLPHLKKMGFGVEIMRVAVSDEMTQCMSTVAVHGATVMVREPEMEYVESFALEVLEVPQILSESNVVGLLVRIVHELVNNEIGESFLQKIHKIFADYACHNSIRANHELSFDEMNALLRLIEVTERSGQCNHGRPSYVRLTKQRIDYMFGR